LLIGLDLLGIAASSGSACTAGSLDASHVLLAIGRTQELARASLRLSLSSFTTDEEVDYVLESLPKVISRLREASTLFAQAEGGVKKV